MTVLSHLSAGWKAWVILTLITLSASLPGVVMAPALDRDESRFAQASKQMLESGDYIRIRYQDGGRNKKPAGIHWLQAGATAAFGEGARTAVWTYRVPSLLGATLATLGVFWCGMVLVGRRAAFLGAALFGAGILLTSEAHIAKTDGVLVFLTVLTMGALARIYSQVAPDMRRPVLAGELVRDLRWQMYLFWGAMGGSFLIKGPVTLLVAGLAIAAIFAARRQAGWLKLVFDWRGMALFAVLVLPWFVWVQIATSGEFLEGAVGKDLKDKFTGASEGHGGWPGYHLLFSITHFFPATLLVIPSIVLATRTLRGRALDVLASERSGLLFLVAWALPTWVFFEFLPTKLSHYILPAYPALALICGWGAVQLMAGVRMPVSRALSLGLFGIGGLVVCVLLSPLGISYLQDEAAADFAHVAGMADVLAQWRGLPGISFHWLVAGAGALSAAVLAGGFGRYGTSIGLGIAASVLIGWHARMEFLPGATWMQPTVTARIALAEVCGLPGEACSLPGPAHVQVVGYAEPSLVLTVGTDTVVPPNTQVDLPADEASYPIVYLLNLEDEAARTALTRLNTLSHGRCVLESELFYALNYSNGDPVAFIARRVDIAGACG